MNQDFSLSTFNKLYYAIVAIATSALFFAFSSNTAYQSGALVGNLISFLLIPMVLAWIIWRITGRREKAGHFTFKILLTLVLVGKLAQVGNDLQRNQALALVLGQAFSESGWNMQLGEFDEVDNLPLCFGEDSYGDPIQLPCGELWLTHRAAEKARAAGIIPVMSVKGQAAIRIGSFLSLNGTPLSGGWT